MITTCYDDNQDAVSCTGFSIADCTDFNTFLKSNVAVRVQDKEGFNEIHTDLNALASTGFAKENLEELLSSDTQEERDWAIGENLAECLLSEQYGVQWPWNMERDKRTPLASLPGAGLVGFVNVDGQITLVIGEVKTSSDLNSPPNVVYGKSGMTNQIEKVATKLSLVMQLIKWLHPRCKNTSFESLFTDSIQHFIQYGNQAISLFGVLIRETSPNEKDLRSRADYLSTKITLPTNCTLVSYYLPFPIAELPAMISEEQ